MDRIICENCGMEYENILQACPGCGCVNAQPAPPAHSGLEEQIFTIPLTREKKAPQEDWMAAEAAQTGQPEPGPEAEAQPAEQPEAGQDMDTGGEEGPLQLPDAPSTSEEEFVITRHSRVREEHYKVPTWALGALCGVLGIAIIAGLIFIISNVTKLADGKNSQDETSGTVTGTLAVDPAQTTLPEAEVPGTGAQTTIPETGLESVDPAQSEQPQSTVPAQTPQTTQPTQEATAQPDPADLVCQSVGLNKSDVTLQYTGETFTLAASVLPVGLASQVVWTSSDEVLVTVDENGVVTALGGRSGETVTITATCQEKSASCLLRFGFTDDPTILQLNYTDVTLTKTGETLALGVTSKLTEELLGQVVWLSDNAAVAVVDETGTVTAIGSGNANVTATLGDRVGTCVIRVK